MLWEIERGLALSAMEVHRASVIRSEWFGTFAGLFETCDALILPSGQVWPFPAEWRSPETIDGHAMDTYHRWMEVVIPVSLVGLPALGIPAGFGTNGLPMGLQLLPPSGRGPRDPAPRPSLSPRDELAKPPPSGSLTPCAPPLGRGRAPPLAP